MARPRPISRRDSSGHALSKVPFPSSADYSSSLIVERFWKKEIAMPEISDTKSVAVVLVHGGFVDGSGWEDVYKILKKDGYDVSIVQNSTISLADDVAVTKRVLAK